MRVPLSWLRELTPLKTRPTDSREVAELAADLDVARFGPLRRTRKQAQRKVSDRNRNQQQHRGVDRLNRRRPEPKQAPAKQ